MFVPLFRYSLRACTDVATNRKKIIQNRLARAEATWDMAENIFQQLADQVRQHEYDIKDLNR